ncbi:MAG: tetratricopeptide repeat protein [Clostridia bacterium]|nr:tetratricopeptide repeat protein [Clostridia bacterium]
MDRIIPYSRPKLDLHQKALDLIDEGNIAAALGAFALAYEETPDDEYLAADYAQCLYAEQCYEESLELLVLAEHYSPEPLPELYYAMACNYIGMGRFYEADSFMAQFAATGPCPDCAGVMEEVNELCENLRRQQAMGETAFHWMEQAERLHADGEHARAETLIRQAMAAEAQNVLIRQRLVSMYMERERPADALKEALEAFENHPENVQLAAQITLIYYVLEDNSNAALWLSKLAALAVTQGQDARLTVMRITHQLHGAEAAWQYAGDAGLNLSCSRASLHETALCAVEAGAPEAAKECWQRIRQINPLDIQARIFIEWADSPNAAEYAGYFDRDYCLPPPTAEAMLNTVLGELQPMTTALERWHTQAAFRERVRWAMHNAPEQSFRQISDFLLAAGDSHAEAALRRFLVAPAEVQNCEIAVATLRRMGSRGPYVIQREGVWMTLSRRPHRNRIPRPGDPYRMARHQAVEASYAQWGDEGRVAAESLFRALLLQIKWPAPRLPDWEALARGVIAATAVHVTAYDAFNIITSSSPAADYWCRRVLQANAGYYNIDMLL